MKKDKNLTNCLTEYYSIENQIFENIKFNLDSQIYHFGENFKSPLESTHISISSTGKKFFRNLFVILKIIQNHKIDNNKRTILSNSYFTLNDELIKKKYQVYCPSWSMSGNRDVLTNLKLFILSERLIYGFKNYNFNLLISQKFTNRISEFKTVLKEFLISKGINAIIVPNDQSFFENIMIEVAKQIGIPSFIFLHGLPARYNNIDENRADYLIVWGNSIRDNYIKAGIPGNKIFVSGHPYYGSFEPKQLSFSLENILVITKSMFWSQYSDKNRLSDRGNLILYLYSLEKVLKKMGVKSVRFRPHPSENAKWYKKFINVDFYKLDTTPIRQSIQNSSLVIGPTSTVFLESIFYGVNYLIYEPSMNNIDMLNYDLVPPFDGRDTRIPVAKDEKQLEILLKNKQSIDSSIFTEYIQIPFCLNFITDLI